MKNEQLDSCDIACLRGLAAECNVLASKIERVPQIERFWDLDEELQEVSDAMVSILNKIEDEPPGAGVPDYDAPSAAERLEMDHRARRETR